MASERQIAANRRNALKSTGLRTQAGRARSRMNALKHGLSRTLPPAQGPDPRLLPLARAIAGESVTDPAALALAEEVAAASLTLASLPLLRGTIVAGDGGGRLRPAEESDEAAPRADPTVELRALERFERQAYTRRSRALVRLEAILTRLRGHDDRR